MVLIRGFGFGMVFFSFILIGLIGLALLFSSGSNRKVSGFLLFLPFLTTRFFGFVLLIPGIRKLALWFLSLKMMGWIQKRAQKFEGSSSGQGFGFKVYSSNPQAEEILRQFANRTRQNGPGQGPIQDVHGHERDVTPRGLSGGENSGEGDKK